MNKVIMVIKNKNKLQVSVSKTKFINLRNMPNEILIKYLYIFKTKLPRL